MLIKVDPNPFIEAVFNKKCGRLFINTSDIFGLEVRSLQERIKELRSDFDFVECILPGNALKLVEELTSLGFSLVCVQPIFEKPLENCALPKPGNIRYPKPTEFPHIIQIAGASFKYDRYSQDRHIPKTNVVNLYSQWTENSLLGRADFVLTDGNGFCSGKIDKLKGWIDLIAVSNNMRKKGVGRNLVIASLWEFKQRGCNSCRVKTELLNLAGVRLYEGLGFKLTDSCLALHWHGNTKKNIS